MARDTARGGTDGELRLLLADDHPAILEALTRYLAGEDGIDVVGLAGDGTHALRLIEERRPDIAVLDVQMPGASGIDVLRKTRGADAPAVILFTGFPDRQLLLEALDAGARGFLLKASPLEALSRAIRTVGDGGTFVDPALEGPAADGPPVLTRREREILRLLADGMRNEEVGQVLSISPLTVRTHVKHAMEKLEAETRTQAVASALRRSLIS